MNNKEKKGLNYSSKTPSPHHTFDVNLIRNHPSLLINDCILVNYLQKEKDSIKKMNGGHN